MQLKTCRKCKDIKALTSFEKNKECILGRTGTCKVCRGLRQREIIDPIKVKNNKLKRVSRNRDFVADFLRDNPCSSCGEKNIVPLQFDHLDPKFKYNSISKMVSDGNSLNKIMSEIDKCRVLCANCHISHTSKQFNWYSLPNHRNAKGTKRNRRYVSKILSASQCIDCGDTDIQHLCFDHKNPEEKVCDVSRLTRGYKLSRLKEEINKCRIVCHNCHAKRTSKQFNWNISCL